MFTFKLEAKRWGRKCEP